MCAGSWFINLPYGHIDTMVTRMITTVSSTIYVSQEEQSLEVQGRWSCSGDGCLFIGGCCIGTYWVLGDALAVLGCPGCIEVYWGKPPISAPATVSPDWCRTGRRLYITHTKTQISDLKEIDSG